MHFFPIICINSRHFERERECVCVCVCCQVLSGHLYICKFYVVHNVIQYSKSNCMCILYLLIYICFHRLFHDKDFSSKYLKDWRSLCQHIEERLETHPWFTACPHGNNIWNILCANNCQLTRFQGF